MWLDVWLGRRIGYPLPFPGRPWSQWSPPLSPHSISRPCCFILTVRLKMDFEDVTSHMSWQGQSAEAGSAHM